MTTVFKYEYKCPYCNKGVEYSGELNEDQLILNPIPVIEHFESDHEDILDQIKKDGIQLGSPKPPAKKRGRPRKNTNT